MPGPDESGGDIRDTRLPLRLSLPSPSHHSAIVTNTNAMLTSLHIQNFKAWRDTGPVRLAPLTVIFGANSAGKSSLGHLMLALKQTVQSTDRRRALHLGDGKSLIDLGTFADCLHGHQSQNPLEFELQWHPPGGFQTEDPISRDSFRGDTISLLTRLEADAQAQAQVSSIRYRLMEGKQSKLEVDFSCSPQGEFALESSSYKLVKTQGRQWPLDAPEKFYRISDASRARFQNAGFLSDLALTAEELLNRFYYLGPLRDHPRRTYQWSGDTPEDVGSKGELTVSAILAADAQERKLNRGPKHKYLLFQAFIATWLKDLGVIDDFLVKPIAAGRKEYEVLVKTGSSTPEVKITDVGFGVSQVLPALVLPFYCPANSIVWMEQPEIHLHPQVQAELADVFISATTARENHKGRNIQLIVESHSEHFLNRLQRRIAEGVISSDNVAVYFCRKNKSGEADMEPLEVNMFGDIENWPENFFGNEMEDLTARTVAAAKKKIAQQIK